MKMRVWAENNEKETNKQKQLKAVIFLQKILS